MQRSRSQTLYRHLPGAVYLHDDELVVKTYRVVGSRLGPTLNKTALLQEIETALRQWPEEMRVGIQLPSRVDETEFLVIEPTTVEWDVWPLVFQCTSRACNRVRRFFQSRQVIDALDDSGRLSCQHCSARLRQLRYYSAHACGRIEQMFVPTCRSCRSSDDVFLEDTGSFETAAWRCRRCGNAYIQGTRMSPCRCGQFIPEGGRQAFMRQYTVRDSRTFFPQTVSLLNLKSRTFDMLQTHHSRGAIAVAAFLRDETQIASALNEVESSVGGATRMSQEEWDEALKTKYRNLDPEDIELIRRRRGPVLEGVAAVGEISQELKSLAESRPVLERATLFDREQISRFTLDDAHAEAVEVGSTLQATTLDYAKRKADAVGLDELAVTMEFPIALAAYGYSRTAKRPGLSNVKGFAEKGQYEGKTPVFAVTTNTEAVLISLSARRVLDWLSQRGSYTGAVPDTDRDARRVILELFSVEDLHPQATTEARTLVHTLSHVLLRALGEGQSGFGESSLAEWLVPETLTFGIYVSSFQSYTLGALWTLLHNRTLEWLERAQGAIWRCDNDPLCHQREPRACERCLFLTFGCPSYNSDLSRSLAMDFWRRTSTS
jgi:hypothetical protein